MTELRVMQVSLQSLSVHSSERLAGLPLGHLLEDGKQKRHVSFNSRVILNAPALSEGQR